ncbi:MAG: hypothetical protein AB7L70_19120 [Pyrinomonadaceae bacterium]
MPAHSTLTGADLHEPKGQAAAAANTLYVANGSGSGTHKKITVDSLDLTAMESPNSVYIHAVLADVSAASSILVPAPGNCTFVSAVMVLGGAITVANSSVTFARNDAASFGSAVTVTYSASAEGTTFTFTPTTNQSITANGYVKITTDGGSTTTQPLYILLKFTRVP